MTTENGIVPATVARKRIEVLRRRLVHIEARLDSDLAYNRGNTYDLAEVTALEWALPVLEAEADWLRDAYRRYGRDIRAPEVSERCPCCGKAGPSKRRANGQDD